VHPIAYRDASYYGVPLVDSPDRLCVAVRSIPNDVRLPPCDYAQVIRARKPLLIDVPIFWRVLTRDQLADVLPTLTADYVRRGEMMIRKGAGVAQGPPASGE